VVGSTQTVYGSLTLFTFGPGLQAYHLAGVFRTERYVVKPTGVPKFAADEAVPLARDCLLDMARHLEQLASELEASARHRAVDQLARIEVH